MPPWLETTLNILISLTMFVGLFGLIVPIFPGNVVMWFAALVYGIVFGFDVLGGIMFAIITLLISFGKHLPVLYVADAGGGLR